MRLHPWLSLLLALALSLFPPFRAHAETAIIAGGCFWCVEKDMESLPGVSEVVSGYTGGAGRDPTYEAHDGHVEAVRVTFDPEVLPYDRLIGLFLRSIDVTDAGGQFCDRGDSYRGAIFVQNNAQARAARDQIVLAQQKLGQVIVTPILPAGTFWPAEDYHQDYYKGTDIVLTRAGPKQKKNAYAFYRNACGRDQRVMELWGDQAVFAK